MFYMGIGALPAIAEQLMAKGMSADTPVALVANEGRFVESCLSKIVDEVRAFPHASLVTYDIELL